MGIVPTDRNRDLRNHETVYPRRSNFDGRLTEAETPHEEKVTTQVITGGSSLELLGGLAALIVAVIGVSAYLPFYMSAIATIAIGVALLAHGGSIAARWREAQRALDTNTHYERTELIGGIGTEVFGGAVGIVLGILALAHVMPFVLMPVAAIVFGASLLLGGASQPDLVHLAPEHDPRYARITYDAIQASGGVMVLVGIAAAVLGILALLHVGPVVTLTLVAMMCIGGALVLAGGALTARFAHRLARVR